MASSLTASLARLLRLLRLIRNFLPSSVLLMLLFLLMLTRKLSSSVSPLVCMCRDCGYIGSDADATCPKCNGEMYQRDDDNEATVRNRLDVYESSTAPLIDYYRGCELLKEIDGDRDPQVVFDAIVSTLACKQVPQYGPRHHLMAGIFFYSRASSERVVRNQYGASVSCKMIRYETY